MNHLIRKTLSIILASVLCFSMLSFHSMAAENSKETATASRSSDFTLENNSIITNSIYQEQATFSVPSSLTIDAATSNPTKEIVAVYSGAPAGRYSLKYDYTYSSFTPEVSIGNFTSSSSNGTITWRLPITGTFEGSVTFTFTLSDKNSGSVLATRTCVVYVTAPDVTVSPASISVEEGSSTKISAYVSNFGSYNSIDIGYTVSSSRISCQFGNELYNGTEFIITGNSAGTAYLNIYLRNTYTGNVISEDTFTVTVNAKPVTPTSISIVNQPHKTTYNVGDTFNANGLRIRLYYSDGSSQLITSGFTTSSPDMSTPGTKTVTVYYSGKSATFNITVNSVEVTSIRIASLPDKRTYYVGETFDYTGIKIRVYYSDSTYKTISGGYTYTTVDTSTPGTKTVTVYYGGQSDTFTINVIERQTRVNATSVDLVILRNFDETDTAQVQAIVNPSNASYSCVRWETSDSRIATVTTDGVITAYDRVGTAIITVTIINYDGTTVSDSIEVTVTEQGNTTPPPSNSGSEGSIFDSIINFFMMILDFLLLPFKLLFGF